MNIKWLGVCAALFACVGLAFFFYAKPDAEELGKYALFNPEMTAEQKADVQQQIDQQLRRKTGGQQVSSTQVAYEKGAVVMTFPVSGAEQKDTNCAYGYFCVWTAWDFGGTKLALQSTPSNSPVNLSDYNMSQQVSSWKYNNQRYSVIVYGVEGPGGQGKVMTCTLKDFHYENECCPLGIPEKTEPVGGWIEIYSESRLIPKNDTMISVVFRPMFSK
ncbi:peptidase inhibitor family I36 protein [Pseudomonas sp. IT-P171]|uniref:peptidase inhibitor family I36 protein n=1 Tax=Pseudomonas sp. IT-P171 TaxID=3026453 RepID=UPI0039E028BE